MRRVTLFVILCSLAIPATASSATQLFRDDFNTLSPNWIKRNSCPNDVTAKGWLCYNPKNVWVSGGKLYLQHSEGTMGRPYDGSMVATYKHGWGWPATNVRRTWPAPVLIEASIKFSGVDGFWQAFMAWSTNLSEPYEFDIAELRGAEERLDFCAIHRDPMKIHMSRILSFSFANGFHRYWARYQSGSVAFGIDDITCGSHSISGAGSVGIAFAATSADPTRFPWAGLGGPMKVSASYAVDWVEVSRP